MAKCINKLTNTVFDIYPYTEELVDGWVQENELPSNCDKNSLISAYNRIGFRPVWLPMQKCYPYINERIFGKVLIKKDSRIVVDNEGNKFLLSKEDFKEFYKEA